MANEILPYPPYQGQPAWPGSQPTPLCFFDADPSPPDNSEWISCVVAKLGTEDYLYVLRIAGAGPDEELRLEKRQWADGVDDHRAGDLLASVTIPFDGYTRFDPFPSLDTDGENLYLMRLMHAGGWHRPTVYLDTYDGALSGSSADISAALLHTYTLDADGYPVQDSRVDFPRSMRRSSNGTLYFRRAYLIWNADGEHRLIGPNLWGWDIVSQTGGVLFDMPPPAGQIGSGFAIEPNFAILHTTHQGQPTVYLAANWIEYPVGQAWRWHNSAWMSWNGGAFNLIDDAFWGGRQVPRRWDAGIINGEPVILSGPPPNSLVNRAADAWGIYCYSLAGGGLDLIGTGIYPGPSTPHSGVPYKLITYHSDLQRQRIISAGLAHLSPSVPQPDPSWLPTHDYLVHQAVFMSWWRGIGGSGNPDGGGGGGGGGAADLSLIQDFADLVHIHVVGSDGLRQYRGMISAVAAATPTVIGDYGVPGCVREPDGHLHLLTDDVAQPPSAVEMTSDDDGGAWSAPVAIGPLAGALRPSIHPLAGGALPQSPGGGGRKAATYLLSVWHDDDILIYRADDAHTWDIVLTLATDVPEQKIDLVVRQGGRILAYYATQAGISSRASADGANTWGAAVAEIANATHPAALILPAGETLLAFWQGDQLMVSRSHWGTGTWTTPINVRDAGAADVPDHGAPHKTALARSAAGTIYLFFFDAHALKVATSTDGGTTWS